ncbi:uncharacterized protein E5676_scaffold244G00490 [Cucumis melo var. makuwa]|uniref:Uncharacterized protein n=1 Tax=Cucumis melo var. makuwa TaxID=1194695 RepID=A0A5D3DUB7_CUCMM|nr:uncharacterized protein E5676_scaffold244G00490 [Cucumis melo var. makuwa]
MGTGFSSKPGGFLVFSDAFSILEVHKSNQKLYLVEIELPVPDTLPKFRIKLQLFYKPSDVKAASYVCWEGSAGIVRGDDVCWLHAVFRAKTAGGRGGVCHEGNSFALAAQ